MVLSSYSVTSTLDTIDVAPGDGVAADENGVATLRAAVMDANALAGADTITLGAGVFTITRVGTGENMSAVGDFDIAGELTIEGAGPDQTILDANLLDRFFHTSTGSTLTLRNLTIRNGRESSGGAIENNGTIILENVTLTGNKSTLRGGAIHNNSGIVTLTGVSIVGNETRDIVSGGGNSIGGALSSFGGTITISNSQLADNVAAAEGGAIDARSANIQVSNTAFSNNSATTGGAIRIFSGTASFINSTWNGDHAVVSGGAIASNYCPIIITGGSFTGNYLGAIPPTGAVRTGGSLYLQGLSSSSTTININGVTFSDTGSGDGGAIYNLNARLNLSNSTFDGVSGRNGGSIYNAHNSFLFMYNTTIVDGTAELGGAIATFGQAELYNNTVSGNTSTGSAFDLAAAVWVGNGSPIVRNNIFAGNFGGRDASGNFSSQGGNVIGVGFGTIGFTHPKDQVGTASAPLDALLSPLADNGGPVKTMAISSLSPARDAGVAGGPAIKDARGMPRSGGISGALYDAGAYEYQNNVPVAGPFLTSTGEDVVLTGLLVGSDADGDALTYELLGQNSFGTIVVEPNGQFTFTPPPNLVGAKFFSYRVSDGRSFSTTVTGRIDVTPVNDPPTVVDQEFMVPEDFTNGALIGFVQASDIDSSSMFGETVVPDATGAIAFSPGGAVYVADSSKLDFENHPTLTIVIRVVDNGNPAASTIATVTVHVTDVNDAPEITTTVYDVLENAPLGSVVATIQATDDDPGQSLTYEFSSGGWPFAIHPQTGEVTVIDAEAVAQEYEQHFFATVRVTDNGNPSRSTEAFVRFHLVPVNDAPTIPDQTFEVPENAYEGMLAGFLQSSDPDSNYRSFQIVSGNESGAFVMNGPFLYVIDPSQLDFETTPTINLVVRVSDDGDPVGTTLANVTINLTDVNEVGEVEWSTFTVDENSPVGTAVGTVNYIDVDAVQNLQFNIVNGPSPFAIDVTTGEITVADSSQLDYESRGGFDLVVMVTDQGDPTYTAFGIITVLLNEVNDPPIVVNSGGFVDENAPNGVGVAPVIAGDIENNDLSFEIVSGNESGAFVFDEFNRAIFVADSTKLDYETNPVFTLVMRVTDNGDPAGSTLGTVTIYLRDVNERPETTSATFSVDEGAANGTAVGTVSFTDPDVGQSHTLSIVETTVPGGFAIDSTTGVITVADGALLNYEARSTHTLRIRIVDSGDPAQFADAIITVQLNNVNEAPVVFPVTVDVDENSPNGTIVLAVDAFDPDRPQALTYAIVGGNTGGAFAIDSATGQVTVARSDFFDFESFASFSLSIQVTDSGSPTKSTSAVFTIQLNDLNEAPTAVDRAFTMSENAGTGAAVGSALAFDPDAGQSLTWSIVGGNTGGAFEINPATGAITVANSAALNFETTPSFALQVSVSDDANPALSDTATMTISLTDVNESPVATGGTFTIAENSANGTVVGSVSASDVDANQTLTYAITFGNDDSAFAIDPSSGQITLANSAVLNYEVQSGRALVISATDNGTPNLTGLASVNVILTDVNEAPSLSGQSLSLAENSANGTAVGTVVGSDPDFAQTLSYAIVSGNTNGAFAINSSTGQITVANSGALNFETTPTFSLVVRATDNGSPSLSATATVTVTLSNVNESPVLGPQSFSVNENSANGTNVGTVSASDPDAGQLLTYSIVSGNTNGAFAINAATGQITVANPAALNFESTPSFSLVVRAADNDSPNLSATATMTISLTNVNEAPVISAQSFSLAENSANGTVVGTVAASDPDAGQTLSYSIVSGNSSGAFAINATTGRITVANAAALDFETTPVFSLQIRATDNGSPVRSSDATVTISLTDVVESLAVAIDVVPGDSSNTIRVGKKFEVAIKSTATFNAQNVNVATVRFGKLGTENSVVKNSRGQITYSYRDVNNDGRLDLVVQIDATKTGLKIGDTLAKLTGNLSNGQAITASSSVIVKK